MASRKGTSWGGSVRATARRVFAPLAGSGRGILGIAIFAVLLLAAGYIETLAAQVVAEVAAGERHPGATKRLLAREIVSLYWDADAAAEAEAAFDVVFKAKGVPDEMPTIALDSSEDVYLPALLELAGMVASRSDGRRLIQQGAVKLDGEKVGEETLAAAALAGRVIQIGKRRFVRVEP